MASLQDKCVLNLNGDSCGYDRMTCSYLYIHYPDIWRDVSRYNHGVSLENMFVCYKHMKQYDQYPRYWKPIPEKTLSVRMLEFCFFKVMRYHYQVMELHKLLFFSKRNSFM